MKKYIVVLSYAIMNVLLFSSCEKVLDLDLNSASSKYVIEGNITNAAGPYEVRVTQTKDFDLDNTFPGISDAIVSIEDSEGNMEVLESIGSGVYQTNTLEGVIGRSYYLSVNIEGEIFTATSTMPEQVFFDSLYVNKDFAFGNDTLKMASVVFQDPENIDNYYRYILYINGEKVDNIFINDDELRDGNEVDRSLFYNAEDDEEIENGDVLEVQMQCVDKDVYHYFFTLSQTISSSAAAPANPISNIQGDALGYFSAHTVQSDDVVVD